MPGNKAVFVKNTDYVPRKEPPSFASGGKVAKVDRVEWLYIPDPATASAALNGGEADWYEQPPADLVPVFAGNPDVVVATVDPLGNQGILRFNHLQPPFDNLELRQAVLNLVDQKDYMQAAAGDPKYWKTCVALFGCGTPLETDAGADALLNRPEPGQGETADRPFRGTRAKRSCCSTRPTSRSCTRRHWSLWRCCAQAGLNVELQALDWGTLITRRASKAPVDQGGWSIFHTWTSAPDLASPAVNAALRGNDGKAWFGWPADPRLEGLIDQWFKASDFAAQKKLAADIQAEAYHDDVPYVPTGQFVVPTAYRRNLHGIIIAPVVFFWNVEKD